MNALFQDRFEAGRQLAEELMHLKESNAVVLAVPRGGLQVGYELATRLQIPLDVVLSKKIGYPGNPEYAIGAVSLEGRILNPEVEVPAHFIEDETWRIRRLLREKLQRYHQGFSPPELEDRTVILVDDGIATGQTMLLTVDLVKQSRPARVILAVPVAPPGVVEKFRDRVDEVVCLETPADFFAIGQFYRSFEQVTDEEAIDLLQRANQGLRV